MLKHGGFRPGSGRKKGKYDSNSPRAIRTRRKVAEDQARTILVEEILKEWRPLIRTRIRLALGQTKVIETGRGVRETGYVVPPDDRAIENLVSYVVAKPKQELRVDTPQLDRIGEAMEFIMSGKADGRIKTIRTIVN